MPRYELLNGARPLASFRLEQNETAAAQDAKTEYRVTDVAVLNGNAALPCGVTHEPYTILSWLVRRRAPTERYHIERVLEASGQT